MPTMRKLRQVLSNFYPIDTGSVLEFMCPAAGFVDCPAYLALEAVPCTPETARKRAPQTFDCGFLKLSFHICNDLMRSKNRRGPSRRAPGKTTTKHKQ